MSDEEKTLIFCLPTDLWKSGFLRRFCIRNAYEFSRVLVAFFL